MNPEDKVTYFAETDFRSQKTKFGIKAKDRSRHMYIIGKTGMGKSTLLENLAIQDIQNGEGVVFIDPHGGTARKLLEYVPEHRVRDVIYFAPADLDHPISFNVLENVDPDKRHLVAGGLMNAFKKIWVDAWSARMEYILNNILLALLEYPGSTLLGVNRMLTDKDFRKDVIAHVTDPSVKDFWTKEFANYTDKYAAEATPAIQNKIGQFTANPVIRNLIGQPKSSFDFRRVMDEKKIIIVNLSKGELGPDNMRLIGGMIVTKLYLAAMSRANVSADVLSRLPPTYFYVDEFQNFANESFSEILSEARKYKLALTVANQYMDQMTDEVRAAVVGNVGTLVSFRVGSTDAEILEKEFTPYFTAEDLVSLGFAQVYLKLMIDGIGSPPFSATTLGPIPKPEHDISERIIAESRAAFAKPREIVQVDINNWLTTPIGPVSKETNSSEGQGKKQFSPQNESKQQISRRDTPKPQENRSVAQDQQRKPSLKDILSKIQSGEVIEIPAQDTANNKKTLDNERAVRPADPKRALPKDTREPHKQDSQSKSPLGASLQDLIQKAKQHPPERAADTAHQTANKSSDDAATTVVPGEVPEETLRKLVHVEE